ncbi:hypothetical protein LR48_Vigan07g108400 [Vigna angularis]|uniref:Uncharacterized protein n=1 Tax=Phaseolus angularis TaxID=3914 RepID=A0A0L9UWZ7_PHAAN|nr:hypothetical protein LR48_Vigan07g108400 [Vigna angularis]
MATRHPAKVQQAWRWGWTRWKQRGTKASPGIGNEEGYVQPPRGGILSHFGGWRATVEGSLPTARYWMKRSGVGKQHVSTPHVSFLTVAC